MFNCPFYEIFTVNQKFLSKLSSYGSANYDLIDACTSFFICNVQRRK